MKQREHFGSRFAVVMAMAGSAVGLGNIWRFPYVLGENGGAAFILIYLVASLLVALPIFYAESVIGRRSRCDTFGAMRKLAPGTAWRWLGLLTIFAPLLLLSYYSVVGGWSVEYLVRSCVFGIAPATDAAEISAFFNDFITSPWRPVLTHTVFMAMVAGIVLGGVKKGIEKFSKIAMPLLFLLIVVLALYSLSLSGASKGVAYLIRPDFSHISASTFTAALGQAFFSLSLGVGTVLTYSSYVRKEENMVSFGIGTATCDLIFALLAAFAVMPAVFAAGIEPGSGPGLVFETFPYIFSQMGGTLPILSAVMAVLFFLTILAAALTSAISMLEVGVTFLTDEKGMMRWKATLLLSVCIWMVGVVCSLSFGVLSPWHILGLSFFDFLDRLCSNWLLPLGGLMFTLFVAWKMPKPDVLDELTNGGTCNRIMARIIYCLMRYVAPLGILVVFVTALFG